MDRTNIDQYVSALRGRIGALYRSAAAAPQNQELLQMAFEELANALEELQVMQHELDLQHERLLESREHVEAELQAYRDHFQYAPIAYLLTTVNGTIRQANLAAAELLSSTESRMVGRSLALFVPEGERRAFRDQIAQAAQSQHPQRWEMRLQPWSGAPLQAALTMMVVRGPRGYPTMLRWLAQPAIAHPPNKELRPASAELAECVRMVGDSSG